jgi:hypothetical protein
VRRVLLVGSIKIAVARSPDQNVRNPVFQIRSSWAQFLLRERFWRVEK